MCYAFETLHCGTTAPRTDMSRVTRVIAVVVHIKSRPASKAAAHFAWSLRWLQKANEVAADYGAQANMRRPFTPSVVSFSHSQSISLGQPERCSRIHQLDIKLTASDHDAFQSLTAPLI